MAPPRVPRPPSTCEACGAVFYRDPWLGQRFCGYKCSTSQPRRSKAPEVLAKQYANWPKGEGAWAWKGDQVGYSALHLWVVKHLGKADMCLMCGIDSRDSKYEWANLSGEYYRDLSDWWPMCISCHRRYDSKRKVNSRRLEMLK